MTPASSATGQDRAHEVLVVGPHPLGGDDLVFDVFVHHPDRVATLVQLGDERLLAVGVAADDRHVEAGHVGAAAARRRPARPPDRIGHEVVAENRDPGLAHRPDRLLVVLDLLIAAPAGRASPCRRSGSARSRSPPSAARTRRTSRPAPAGPRPPTPSPGSRGVFICTPPTPSWAANFSFSSVNSLNCPTAIRIPSPFPPSTTTASSVARSRAPTTRSRSIQLDRDHTQHPPTRHDRFQPRQSLPRDRSTAFTPRLVRQWKDV